jgi:IPT/TIG domain/Cep192 domain 4
MLHKAKVMLLGSRCLLRLTTCAAIQTDVELTPADLLTHGSRNAAPGQAAWIVNAGSNGVRKAGLRLRNPRFVVLIALTTAIAAFEAARPAYAQTNLIQDPGFEQQTSKSGGPLVPPWVAQGPATVGLDFSGVAHSGAKDGYIYSGTSSAWTAITQTVTSGVTANTNYTLTGWLQNSNTAGFAGGFFGVRTTGGTLIAQTAIPLTAPYIQLTVNFNSGSNTSLVVFGGYTPGSASLSWMHLDDVSLVAVAPAVSFSPASLAFGNQALGTSSSTQTVSLTNSGTATLNISSVSITGANPGDFSDTTTCGSTLSQSSSCNIVVTFRPAATGPRSASISVADNAAGSPQNIPLTGTGAAPAVSFSPASLAFGNQVLGTSSSTQTVSLTNSGTATLNLSGVTITGANPGDFSDTTTCGSTLSPSSSCNIVVTFRPAATGPRSASISVADNASGTPQTIPLTGTGVAPAASFSPTSLAFGNQAVGTPSSTQTVSLTNSGTATLNLSGITITGANSGDFSDTTTCGSTLSPSSSCNMVVTFRPAATGPRSASISVADDASGTPQNIPLTGTGVAPALSFSPASVAFGNQVLGTSSSTQTVSLTNSGTATLNLSGITITGANSGDFSDTTTCGSTLSPSSTCNIVVTFSPAATGPRSASISVADDAAGSPQTIPLTGTGVAPALSFSPASVAFGNQAVGTSSSTQSVQLTNTGTTTLNISSVDITGANSGDFTTTCGSTLAPSSSCNIVVSFTPTATGSRSASISVTHDAAGSPQSIPLTGTGVAPAASFSPASLAFGSQTLGTSSSTQTVSLTNSGTATLNLSGITVTGANSGDFSDTTTCGSTLSQSSSCDIVVTFSPAAMGPRSASISVADDASGSPQTIPLTGTGVAPAASFSPASLAFGNQVLGTSSSTQTVSLTNSGTATLNLSGITISGANPGDFSDTTTCGPTLSPSSTCNIVVTFSPAATGPRSASICVADDASGSPQTIPLTGTGVAPALSFSPASVAFSDQTVGTSSSTQTVSLTNSGTAALNISGITVTGANAGDFSDTTTCGPTLSQSSSCNIVVTFTPTAAESRSASVSIADDAAGSPQTVALTGTGVAPAPSELMQDPGFEQQTSQSGGPLVPPWVAQGPATVGLDASGVAHSGAKDGYIYSGTSSAWTAITQTVTSGVTANTNYTLTGWLQNSNTAGFAGGFFGVRTTGGTLIAQTAIPLTAPYIQLSVTFNSGSNTSLVVFAGYTPGSASSSWMHLDDVSLTLSSGPPPPPPPPPPAPTISSVSPTSGTIAGGTTVTISGTSFQSGAKVALGAILATSVTVISSTQIQAVTPGQSAGTVGVTVTNSDGGTATLANAFTYLAGLIVSSISPSIGQSGSTVGVWGSNFVSGAKVQFASNSSSSVTWVSSSQLNAVVPTGSGTVNVKATNPDGSSATLTNGFTYGTPQGLLTGCTVNSNNGLNCTVPTGWSLAYAQGFETGSLGAGQTFAGSTNFTTAKAHTGTHSASRTYASDGQAAGLVGPVNSRTLYASWWEWDDSAGRFNDEVFLARPYLNDSNGNLLQEVILDFFNGRSCPGDSYGTGFNATQGHLVVESQTTNRQVGVTKTTWGPCSPATYYNSGWNQWEVYFKANDPGASNGEFDVYFNGSLFWQLSNQNFNGTIDMTNQRLEIGGVITKLTWYHDTAHTTCGSYLGDGVDNGPHITDFTKTCVCTNECPPSGYVPVFTRYFDDIILLKR